MTTAAETFLPGWHRIVATRDKAALEHVLADDVTIGAPPYWTKLEGKAIVHHLLGIIIETIDGFTYHREWWRERDLALEFTGKVEALDLQGIDLISLDADGRIANLDVLMRPINAIARLQELVAPQMQAFLARGA